MKDSLSTNADRRASSKLSAFISEMRQANPYAIDSWGAACWEVGRARRASARVNERLHFTRHAPSDGRIELGPALLGNFADFARALVVYRAINSSQIPTASAQMVMIRALRYLYEELIKACKDISTGPCPTKLKPLHFQMATQESVAKESVQSSYRVANYLEYVAKQVDRLGLTATPLRWHHDVARPASCGGLLSDRIGSEFQRRREKFLPADEVMYAVADISNASDLLPPDQIRQRLVDLLFCGGFRINEALTIRRDALVEEVVFDDLGQPAVDQDGRPLTPYLGLRYLPEKGGDGVSRIKWFPSDLAPIARRAFTELMELTSGFSADAKFAYENPGRARLGEPWDSLSDDAVLTRDQIVEMVGLSNPSSVYYWVDKNLGTAARSGGRFSYTKREVEIAIASLMDPLEVIVKDVATPLHEFLAVVPVNFFHSQKASVRGTVELVSDQNISDFLCGRGRSDVGRTRSIFERRGSRLSNGDPIRISTHQFRHFMDTVAATGGVSDLVRARWMGRKDLSQNSAYDHESGTSLARKIRLRLVEGGVIGPIADITSRLTDPVAREKRAAEDLIRAVHKTQLGRCFHDWAASPCPEHEACWGCDEHLVVKGSPVEIEEAERQMAETILAIEIVERERADKTFGVDNWAIAHYRKRDSLAKVLEVHRNPDIPDGTHVHLGRDRDRAADGRRAGS